MRKTIPLALISIGLWHAGTAWSEVPSPLRNGSYEVSVNLELPFVEDTTARRVATLCIVAAATSGTQGLIVMSQNNPLGQCPASNIQHDGDMLTFDIACPGGNAAIGTARYTLFADRFEGRIAMKMGGKNMTMTEVQSGRRTGDCQPTNPTH